MLIESALTIDNKKGGFTFVGFNLLVQVNSSFLTVLFID